MCIWADRVSGCVFPRDATAFIVMTATAGGQEEIRFAATTRSEPSASQPAGALEGCEWGQQCICVCVCVFVCAHVAMKVVLSALYWFLTLR